MLRSVTVSIKDQDQLTLSGSPLLPSDPATFTYQGEELELFQVPIDGAIRELALLQPGRQQSTFIDPAAPDAAADHLAGLVADARAGLACSRRTSTTSRRSGT